MLVQTLFSREVLEAARTAYAAWQDDALVQYRQRRNVDGDRPPVTRDEVWLKIVTALLTTQQHSGPHSPVTRFLAVRPFPLRLARCRRAEALETFVRCKLRRFGGIRFWAKIAEALNQNLMWLDHGNNWDRVMGWMERLADDPSQGEERSAARFLADNLRGIGPKQSRNVLQMLGLSRYETPIDRRVTRRLREIGFPVAITTRLLADEASYCRVLDVFQELCLEIGVFPCLFDSALFASFDDGEWSEESVEFA